MDGNKVLEVSDLKALMPAGKTKVSDSLLTFIIKEIDSAKDGKVSYEEFEAIMKKGANMK